MKRIGKHLSVEPRPASKHASARCEARSYEKSSSLRQYLDLLARIRKTGIRKDDRTNTGTLSIFGHQMRFDLAEGFPLVTTKKLHVKSIIHDLMWFLQGSTNECYLNVPAGTVWAGPPAGSAARRSGTSGLTSTQTSGLRTEDSGARGQRLKAATSTRSQDLSKA